MRSKGLKVPMALLLLLSGIAGARPAAEGIYTDVPRGHWAYESVKKAAESGILQGYDGKFHGNKTINRYQMALIVARLLDRVGKGGDAVRNLSENDLQNLEALTIEFADELALLNVKVSTLEDSFAELKHDVEAIKTGGYHGQRRGPGRQSAGIHGMGSLRLVSTGANGEAGAVGGVGGVFTPQTRYSGDVVGALPAQSFNSRVFFTVPQVSMSVDRDIDEGIGVHLQLDFDADTGDNQNSPAGPTAADLVGGASIQVNEAYLDVDDFFYGVGARMGAFALPVSREHNGTHRTLDYTISPSAVSNRIESYRPVGIEFRNQDDVVHWDWRLGVFSGLAGGPPTAGGAVFNQINGILAPSMAYAMMAGAPNTFANRTFSDSPWGIQGTDFTAGGVLGNGLNTGSFGIFARVGDQPDEGFGWDINFLQNGGSVSASTSKRVSATEFSWIVGTVDYYWKYFDIVAQVYAGETTNTATTGQIPNAAGDSVASQGAYALFNYRFDPDNNFTVRYETATDEVSSIGKVTINTITVGYNRIISDHSLFQIEYILPTAEYTAAAVGVAGSQATNTTDNADELISANYKLKW